MKDVSGKIEYRGKTYRLVFNLNVMELIQDEYGTIEKWGEITEGGNAKAIKYGFAAMINEGIDIDNDENGTDEKPFTLAQVGRLLTEYGLDNAFQTLNDIVAESVENEEKNG